MLELNTRSRGKVGEESTDMGQSKITGHFRNAKKKAAQKAKSTLAKANLLQKEP